ncbi:MAG: MBL fold metallo-hydrolase, partial [Chloroflexota bacterium]
YIIMDALQTVNVAQQAPDSTIVATHMEALDHCTTTRLALRDAATQAGISAGRLLIPVDSDTLTL